MPAANTRALLAGLVVVAVGLFGEVGWSLVYLAAGLMLTVVSMAVAMDTAFKVRFFEAILWVAIGWGVVAAFLTSGSTLASKVTLASWGGALIIWTAVAQSRSRGRRFVSTGLLGGALVLGGAVIAGFGGAPDLIANHNILVAMIVSAVPLVLERFRSPWRSHLAVALMLIPVLMTGSRAGVLAVLVVMISLWPAGRGRRWAVVVGAGGGVAVIAWRLITHPDSLAWYRWRIWGSVIESIGERPLWGIGAGSVADAMGPYRLEHATEVGRWGHIIGGAESMPLGLALRVGLPALILVSIAFGLWFFRHRRPARTTTAILGAMITMGLFHDFWFEPAVLWWWAAVLGLLTLRPYARARTAEPLHRWALGLAVGGITAWALVQPAWAQWLWWHSDPSPKRVVNAVRAEPWFSQPMRWRVENLLGERNWTWEEASEALEWSRRNLEIRTGFAGAWDLQGRVDDRIVEEFGAWPVTVQEARKAFSRASALEPHLPWYPYRQALMERRIGNTKGALTLIRQSVELEPNFARGWLLLSRLELDAGHLQSARRALDKAVVSHDVAEMRVWTDYHRDLVWFPEQHLLELERELE